MGLIFLNRILLLKQDQEPDDLTKQTALLCFSGVLKSDEDVSLQNYEGLIIGVSTKV